MSAPQSAAAVANVVHDDTDHKVSIVVDKVVSETALPPASIILLLDESGSMDGNRNEILQSVNKFIRDQQSKPEDGTTLSVLTFSDRVKVLISSKPLADVLPLTREDYHPDGMTALYDAIGSAIDDHAGRQRVLMVVVTDGDENSSKNFNKQTIKAKIDSVKAIGWNFIFLANNLDTSSGGDRIGIARAAAGTQYSNVNNIAVGYEGMGAALERCVSAAAACYRVSSYVPNLNQDAEGAEQKVQGSAPAVHSVSEANEGAVDQDVEPMLAMPMRAPSVVYDEANIAVDDAASGVGRSSSLMEAGLVRTRAQHDLMNPTLSREPSSDSSSY